MNHMDVMRAKTDKDAQAYGAKSSEMYRQVFVLWEKGQDVEAIAERLGIDEGRVEDRLHWGRSLGFLHGTTVNWRLWGESPDGQLYKEYSPAAQARREQDKKKKGGSE